MDECIKTLYLDSKDYFKFYNLFLEELIQVIYQLFKILNIIIDNDKSKCRR